jgi:hypothetical protein
MLIQRYLDDPIASVVRAIRDLLGSFMDTTLLAFYTPLKTGLKSVDLRDKAFAVMLAVVCMVLFWLYTRSISRIQNNTPPHKGSTSSRHAIWIGVSILLMTLFVVTLTGRKVSFTSDFSRYTMQASLGVPILIVGVLYTFFTARFRQGILLLLIFVSVITHFNNAAAFKNKWDITRQLWWQMSWRVPQIKKGTTLMVLLPEGYRIREGSTIFAAANLIYYPNSEGPLAIYGEVIDEGTIEQAANQEVILKYTRTLPIHYDFSKTIVATMPDPESCLHVIDGDLIELPTTTDPRIYTIAGYSRIDLIDLSEEEKIPPQAPFGEEPPHTWCYYYQKASLARQRGDWEKIVSLGEEAAELGFGPRHTSEWMPFFVGYIRAGRAADAAIIRGYILEDISFVQSFCSQFDGDDLTGENSELLIAQKLCE